MDATTQALLAAVIGAAVASAAVLAWHATERQQHQVVATADAAVIPPEVATVLSVLRSSAVLVDDSDSVVKASAPAYALGLVKGHKLVSHELADLVSQVRRDGQIRETELLMSRPGMSVRHVTARIAPLGSRLVLALVEDRTRERRVEAVRRDFVANVSHELKTPVGAIRLLADAVADAAEDPMAVKRFAGRMLIESDRLTQLVQQIIELSRLQADDPLETPGEVDVDLVIKVAADTVAMDAQAKRIRVVTGGSHGLKVLGSTEQVGAAVHNLVANAVSYSDPDQPVLVSTTAAEGSVEISVVDQGIGIPENEVDRIFERFYRVDPARHRSTGGTGLGLSIVKHVAATHGGDVRVWSVEGQGSTFTLTLPQQLPRVAHARGLDPDEDPDEGYVLLRPTPHQVAPSSATTVQQEERP
ncbi:MAG: two-component sensor histidine kinase [Nocardioides sp.]|nr:two-component sensor histidine kinase [Nocardioides sp.]